MDSWTDGLIYLTFTAAGVTILGAIPRALQAISGLWTATGGRRKAQSDVLDKLACGSTQQFVDELLGTPQFVTIVDDRMPRLSTDKKQIRRHRIHRLRAAWVTTEFHEDALIAFSVTITAPSMHYRIDRQAHGLLRGRLGKDAFDGISTEGPPQGVFAWLGARSTGYIEHYYFGNSGGYQQYWLSSNPIGAGQRTLPPPSEYRTGTYASRGGPQPSNSESPNRAEIPANTITVLGPNAPSDAVDDMLNRWTHGAENDVVRLDVRDVRRPKRPRRRVWLSLSARDAASK